jgi:hypothetical protein
MPGRQCLLAASVSREDDGKPAAGMTTGAAGQAYA